jgi:hypothetical protein
MKTAGNQTGIGLAGMILYIILAYTLSLVVFDLIGVAATFLAEVFTHRGKSELLFYAIWFVAAIFNGLFFVSFSYEKMQENKMVSKNWMIVALCVLLGVLALLIFHWFGQMQDSGSSEFNHWVPGDKGLTYTYFITFMLSTFFFHNMEEWNRKRYIKKNHKQL